MSDTLPKKPIAPDIPRSIRNNNPGNLMTDHGWDWDGQIGHDLRGFVMFSNPYYGVRAMLITLLAYYNNHHLDTITKIINRYDESSHRSHAHYIDFVSEYVDIQPLKAIYALHQLSTIAHAMTIFETGYEYVTLDLFKTAMDDLRPSGNI